MSQHRHRILEPRTAARVLVGLFLGALGSHLGAQGVSTQTFTLSEHTNDELHIHVVASDRPGSDWNHFDMKVAETPIRSILPNYLSGDPVNIEEMNRFNKHLVSDTVMQAGGQIATWYQDGTLVAVEFAVLPSDPFPPPQPGEYLPEVGGILGEDLLGQPGQQLGTMYCYDQAQYAARVAVIVAILGHDLNEPTVWLGDTLHSGSTDDLPLRLQGSYNTTVGSVRSGGGILLGGEAWTMLQRIFRNGFLVESGSGHQLGPISVEGPLAVVAAAHDAPWYQAQAVANGTFFSGDLHIVEDGKGGLASRDGTQLSGVVYVVGDILVESSGIAGTVTLVSEGSIDVGASGCLLEAAVDDLLMWSVSTEATDAIAVDGSGCVLTGAVCVPDAAFRMGGSNNSLTGRVAADTIKITGTQDVFTDGTK